MSRRRKAATVAIQCLALGMLQLPLISCAQPSFEQRSEQRFQQWSTTAQASGMPEYQRYLDSHGLSDVSPMQSLLHSARRWRECDAAEYALPPQDLWPNMLPTLRVLRELQTAGLVDGRQVASGYRDAALNLCAGGSARSRHLTNNALDFDLQSSPGHVERLCSFWRMQGPALKLGLGFYTDSKIHLDTAGFRSWGGDHSWRTSLCNPDHVAP